jgi:GDP-D-mannose 3', 5'-epimerase
MAIGHLHRGHVADGRDAVLVAGGGGFIGGHLARTLSERGVQVRSVDIKPLDEWYQIPEGVEARQLDLSALADCREAVRGIDTVYNLAADMGGMGFIETHKAECMLSVLINTHMLMAARAQTLVGTSSLARLVSTPPTSR